MIQPQEHDYRIWVKEDLLNTLSEVHDIDPKKFEWRDEMYETLSHEIDHMVIYYKDCWDILNAFRPTSFEIEATGEYASGVMELAYHILWEFAYEILSMYISSE